MKKTIKNSIFLLLLLCIGNLQGFAQTDENDGEQDGEDWSVDWEDDNTTTVITNDIILSEIIPTLDTAVASISSTECCADSDGIFNFYTGGIDLDAGYYPQELRLKHYQLSGDKNFLASPNNVVSYSGGNINFSINTFQNVGGYHTTSTEFIIELEQETAAIRDRYLAERMASDKKKLEDQFAQITEKISARYYGKSFENFNEAFFYTVTEHNEKVVYHQLYNEKLRIHHHKLQTISYRKKLLQDLKLLHQWKDHKNVLRDSSIANTELKFNGQEIALKDINGILEQLVIDEYTNEFKNNEVHLRQSISYIRRMNEAIFNRNNDFERIKNTLIRDDINTFNNASSYEEQIAFANAIIEALEGGRCYSFDEDGRVYQSGIVGCGVGNNYTFNYTKYHYLDYNGVYVQNGSRILGAFYQTHPILAFELRAFGLGYYNSLSLEDRRRADEIVNRVLNEALENTDSTPITDGSCKKRIGYLHDANFINKTPFLGNNTTTKEDNFRNNGDWSIITAANCGMGKVPKSSIVNVLSTDATIRTMGSTTLKYYQVEYDECDENNDFRRECSCARKILKQHLIDKAKELGVEVRNILAVYNVETGGSAFTKEGIPKLLFERHHFSKYTNHIYDKTNSDISGLKRSKYGSYKEQLKYIKEAYVLDPVAAVKSASFGAFQILGSNYGLAGYSNMNDFYKDMISTDANIHLNAFISFVTKKGLIDELKTEDWHEFARGYNGKNYDKKGSASKNYDKKMADESKKYKDNPSFIDDKNCF